MINFILYDIRNKCNEIYQYPEDLFVFFKNKFIAKAAFLPLLESLKC